MWVAVFCCGCGTSDDNLFLVMGGIKLTTAVVIVNIVFCCGCGTSGDNMFLVMGGIKLTTAVVIVL